jgi:hypothetical protein
LKPFDQVKMREKVLESFRIPELGGFIKWGYVMVLLIKYYPESIVQQLCRALVAPEGQRIPKRTLR